MIIVVISFMVCRAWAGHGARLQSKSLSIISTDKWNYLFDQPNSAAACVEPYAFLNNLITHPGLYVQAVWCQRESVVVVWLHLSIFVLFKPVTAVPYLSIA